MVLISNKHKNIIMRHKVLTIRDHITEPDKTNLATHDNVLPYRKTVG